MDYLNSIELANNQFMDIQDSLVRMIDSCDTIIYLSRNQAQDLHSEITYLNMTLGETEMVLKGATETINTQRQEIKKQKRLKTAIGSVGILVTLILLIKLL